LRIPSLGTFKIVSYLRTIVIASLSGCSRQNTSIAETPNKSSQDPCGKHGVRYAPVGQIARMDQIALKDRRDYATHVLLDSSGKIQWVLKSPTENLDTIAGDGHWYRVQGEISSEHPDLFIVCLSSFE
jgi:hypothetical protein